MKIIIKSKNIELTPAIESYINKKLKFIDKLLEKHLKNAEAIVNIEIAKTTLHHRKGNIFYAEANLTLPSKFLRAEEQNINLYAAIDLLKDKIKQEILKFKSKDLKKR